MRISDWSSDVCSSDLGNVRDFVALQRATTPDPATGKPDPAAVDAFMAAHPETRAFGELMRTRPIPSSFANGSYHSINAFRFVDANGSSRAVHWSMQPEAAFSRSEEHTSELQSLMRISYAVFCLKKKTNHKMPSK